VSDVPKWPAEPPDLGALSGHAPELAQTLVSVASDIALVIDADGVIRNVAVGNDRIGGTLQDWVGRTWAETVTGDTRSKVELLLSEVQAGGVTRRREVNHSTQDGQGIPVAYSAIRLGSDGPVLAVGRDLRAVAAIQQRFIDAQQQMERDHWKQRQAESRYRLLFQVANDAVMVVDAQSLLIIEANRAAGALLGCASESLIGQSPASGVALAARPAVEELLLTARASGRPAEIRAPCARDGRRVPQALVIDISATPLRAEEGMLLLVRARAVKPTGSLQGSELRLSDFVERTPDAVAVTDSSGRVLSANPAFEALCAAGTEGPVPGRSLAELLGDPQLSLAAILAATRRLGIAEQKHALIGRSIGQGTEIEVSAALLAEGDQECIGLTLRRIDHRSAGTTPQRAELVGLIDHLAARVGVVGLDELLHEAAQFAERHLIQVALARTQGQTPNAARLLGIDLDSLRLRMRLLGIEPDGPGHDAPAHSLN